jgi:hypothetical protein
MTRVCTGISTSVAAARAEYDSSPSAGGQSIKMMSQRSWGSSSMAWSRIISAPAWVEALRSARVIHDDDGTRSMLSTCVGRTAFSSGAPLSNTS